MFKAPVFQSSTASAIAAALFVSGCALSPNAPPPVDMPVATTPPVLQPRERLYRALAPRLSGTLVINLLPRTRLELTRVLMLLEQWVGPTTPYPVPGLRNVLLHTAPRYELASDL